MASSERDENGDSLERQINPSKTIFFVDEKLVRFVNSNRGANIVYLYDIVNEKEITMLLSDFKKHRKRAYLVSHTAKLLGRTHMQLNKYVRQGLINPPVGAVAGGKNVFRKKAYYSEDYIFTIREIMSTIHRGRPRKDGRISNSVLTEQELRAKMGDALMLYTRTKDGEFIPVWSEQTY
jgi:hypothetical protein